MLVLLMLLDATRFRRPETWRRRARSCSSAGSPSPCVSVGHQVVSAIETHNFAVGHDFTNHAVEQALTKGTANVLVDYLDLLAGLALAAGMIAVMLNALRVGLLPRWMGILGIFTGVLIFLPIGGAELADRARLLDGDDGRAATSGAGPTASRPRGPPARRGRGPPQARCGPSARRRTAGRRPPAAGAGDGARAGAAGRPAAPRASAGASAAARG